MATGCNARGMRMRSLTILGAMLLLASRHLAGQTVGSFECQPLGSFPLIGAPPDCEGCTSNGAQLDIRGNWPTGVFSWPTQNCGFPGAGVRAARIIGYSTTATAVPPNGPYPRPASAAHTELRIAVPARPDRESGVEG